MKKCLVFIIIGLFEVTGSFAQDTVKVRRPDDDRFCTLMLCLKNECFADTIPAHILRSDQKFELRINEKCNAKKRTDVFVKSFESIIITDGVKEQMAIHSSFFTERQMKAIRNLKPGQSVEIKNVVVHGPDAFRKMEDIKFTIK
ncbi:MAG TPA: hypothetical protein VF868_04355 [Bacteroidia bacterium]|jgi:hypothetical protein